MAKIRNFFVRTGLGASQTAAAPADETALVLDANRTGGGGQTIPTAVNTEVIFTNEVTDPNGWYNPANGRFTPNVAGWYEFHAYVITEYATGITGPAISLCKNGGSPFFGLYFNQAFTGGIGACVTGRFYLNGTTDYVSVWFQHASGSNRSTNTTHPANVYFKAFKK